MGGSDAELDVVIIGLESVVGPLSSDRDWFMSVLDTIYLSGQNAYLKGA